MSSTAVTVACEYVFQESVAYARHLTRFNISDVIWKNICVNSNPALVTPTVSQNAQEKTHS